MNVYEAANAMWSYGMLFESGAFPALSGETLKALTEASARVIKGDAPVNNVNDIMWAYLRIYQYGDGQASYDFGPLDTHLLQALCEKVILHGKADGWELKVVPLGIAMRAYNKMYDIGAVSELGEKMADRMISEASRSLLRFSRGATATFGPVAGGGGGSSRRAAFRPPHPAREKSRRAHRKNPSARLFPVSTDIGRPAPEGIQGRPAPHAATLSS